MCHSESAGVGPNSVSRPLYTVSRLSILTKVFAHSQRANETYMHLIQFLLFQLQYFILQHWIIWGGTNRCVISQTSERMSVRCEVTLGYTQVAVQSCTWSQQVQ